jgi:hypothetical protein
MPVRDGALQQPPGSSSQQIDRHISPGMGSLVESLQPFVPVMGGESGETGFLLFPLRHSLYRLLVAYWQGNRILMRCCGPVVWAPLRTVTCSCHGCPLGLPLLR